MLYVMLLLSLSVFVCMILIDCVVVVDDDLVVVVIAVVSVVVDFCLY